MYSVTREQLFIPLQKVVPGENELAFSYQTKSENINKWAANMPMFHVDVNMKRLGIRFKKTTRFNDSESTLSFQRQLIQGDFRFKTCRIFSFT